MALSSLNLDQLRGGGDDDETESDDNDAPRASLPGYVPSCASGMPGDIDAADAQNQEILVRFSDHNSNELTIGEWVDSVDGHGDGAGRRGTFGVFQGNWGEKWKDLSLQEHMFRDVKSTPCSILMMQEAWQNLFEFLKTVGELGVPIIDAEPTDDLIGVEREQDRPANSSDSEGLRRNTAS